MKKRILHVLYRLDQGGIENLIMNLYRNIDRDEYEFDFALISGEKSWFDDEVKELGGQIFYFNRPGKKRIYENLKEIIREKGPFDVIHSHCYFFSGVILSIARSMGVPIRIAHAHDVYKGQKYSMYRIMYENAMRYLIGRNATYKLGCSKQACEFVFGKIDSKTVVLKNGIDLNKFSYNEIVRKQVREELKLGKCIVIGHVGRFEDQKDHSYLIEIFNRILMTNGNVRLMLVGDGKLKEDMIHKTIKMGIDDKVLFLGNSQDVHILMQAMDYFVFPSKYEGLGIVVVEACASGLKCFVSDLVPEETKLLGDVVVLSKESISKWCEEILAVGTYDRNRIEGYRNIEGYSITKVVELLGKIYEGEL